MKLSNALFFLCVIATKADNGNLRSPMINNKEDGALTGSSQRVLTDKVTVCNDKGVTRSFDQDVAARKIRKGLAVPGPCEEEEAEEEDAPTTDLEEEELSDVKTFDEKTFVGNSGMQHEWHEIGHADAGEGEPGPAHFRALEETSENSRQLNRYFVEVDCQHDSYNDFAGTDDAVQVEFYDSQQKLIGATSAKNRCDTHWLFGEEPAEFNVNIAFKVHYFDLVATGVDALIIDEARIFDYKYSTINFGVDGHGVWCLSKDFGDSRSGTYGLCYYRLRYVRYTTGWMQAGLVYGWY